MRLALVTRFPAVMMARDTWPSIGARTSVNSRFRRASCNECIDRTQGSLSRGFGRHLPLVFLARDGVRADQPFGARAVGLGEFEVRHAARALRDQPLDFRLEGTRIDLEQQLAFLHACTIREGDAVDIAAHSRTHLHRVHGLQTTAEFLPFTQRPVDHLGHLHLRQGGLRRRRRLGAGVSGAGIEQQRLRWRRGQAERGKSFCERCG